MIVQILDGLLGLITAGSGLVLATLLYRDPPVESPAAWALAVIAGAVIAGGVRLLAVGVWG